MERVFAMAHSSPFASADGAKWYVQMANGERRRVVRTETGIAFVRRDGKAARKKLKRAGAR